MAGSRIQEPNVEISDHSQWIVLDQYCVKDDATSVPLSDATPDHHFVHNDILKVALVAANSVDKDWLARRLTNSTRSIRTDQMSSTLSIDVHEWRTERKEHSPSIQCKVWNVQGAESGLEDRSDFGAHPAVQSLFFSPRSLFILVWDLAACNAEANCSDFDDDDDDEQSEQADRALHADIKDRALMWLDCIAQNCPHSAVLPVALIPEGMRAPEVKRRCDFFQNALKDHVRRIEMGKSPPKLFMGATGNVIRIDSFGAEAQGMEQLQDRIVSIATDPSHSVFDRIGAPISRDTMLVYHTIQKLKNDHKFISLDRVLAELESENVGEEEVVDALEYIASLGEILYVSGGDQVLSRYIILDHHWLMSALSCILRNSLSNDFKQVLDRTRRYMNQQYFGTSTAYRESEITQALIRNDTSNCPLLSSDDATMLWHYMSSRRETQGRSSFLSENLTNRETLYDFLERLLVHSNIFLPLDVTLGPSTSSLNKRVFFVPSLLIQEEPPAELWTFMTSESYRTTLCHSWLFCEGAQPDLMETIAVKVLRGLYDFSGTEITDGQHCSTRIRYVVCFKSCMLIRIETSFAGASQKDYVDVFVALVDRASPHSVASDAMDSGMQRLVVSGRGQAGHHGRKLWKGGYQCILDSVRETLSSTSNVESQVICPECLAHHNPQSARTWSWDCVEAAAHSYHPDICCSRGHRVNSKLICGKCSKKTVPVVDPHFLRRESLVGITERLPSIVLVGVWDPDSRSIINVGSGFIVDKNEGLVVTAAHVLMEIKNSKKEIFGRPYFGRPNGRAVIAVIPDAREGGSQAVFRYFAEIVVHGKLEVDACVLRITARLENDADHAAKIADQQEYPITTAQMPDQRLSSLIMVKDFQLEEAIRIAGYNQEGEGLYEKGSYISLSADFVFGHICRSFNAPNQVCHDSSNRSFKPNSEIVATCFTRPILGHSGGPCINSEGKVLGILSRSDSTEKERCYIVPVSEIQSLVARAKLLS